MMLGERLQCVASCAVSVVTITCNEKEVTCLEKQSGL